MRAFPSEQGTDPNGCWNQSYEAGMSLRDYFAAKAMATFLQGAVLPTKADREKWLPITAEIAYEAADAMMKAREVTCQP